MPNFLMTGQPVQKRVLECQALSKAGSRPWDTWLNVNGVCQTVCWLSWASNSAVASCLAERRWLRRANSKCICKHARGGQQCK